MTKGRTAGALGLGWLVVVLLLVPRHGALLNWDEVDYVLAARQGVVANWLERGGLPLASFLSFVSARFGDAPVTFPAGYDESTDPLLLRHLHPPLLVYVLAPLSRSGSERVLRLILLIGVGALFWALYRSCRPVGPPDRWGLALLLLLGTWAGLHGFATLHMHGLMAVTALLAVTLFVDWLDGAPERSPVLPALGLAIVGLTLESAAVVWAGLFVAALLWRSALDEGELRTVRTRLRSTLPLFGLGLVFLATLWIGGMVKASFLRTAANYAYRFALGSEYASVGTRLPGVARACLPVLVLGALAMGARAATGVRLSRRARTFLAVGGAYGLVMLAVALSETYLIPAGVLLAVPSLEALSHVEKAFARGAIVVLVGVALAASSPPIGRGEADVRLREDYAWLAEEGRLEGRTIWADGGHIFRYYFPDARIRSMTVSYDGTSLTERVGGRYRALTSSDVGSALVLIDASRGGSALETTDGPLSGCTRTPRPSFVLYDCTGRVR